MSTTRLSDLDFNGEIFEFEDLLAQNRLDHLTYSTLAAMEEDASLEVNDSAVVNGGIFDVHEVINVENEEDMTDPDTIYYYNGVHYYGDNGGEAIGFETVNGFAVLSDRNLFITPEMFGAVGDGVHDDTEKIQKCIDANSNSTIVFTKKYLITAPLIMEFNNSSLYLLPTAVIKAGASMDYLLYFHRTTFYNNQFIKGGIWDGNGLAKNGIYLAYFAKLSISNLYIKDCTEVEINCCGNESSHGNELTLSNCRLENTLPYNQSPTVIGVLVNVTDSVIDNIITVDMTTGFDLRQNAVYKNLHPWLTGNVFRSSGTDHNRMTHTIGILVSASTATLDSCEFDTLAIGIKQDGYKRTTLNNCYFMFPFQAENVTPEYIAATQGYITCNDCHFAAINNSNAQSVVLTTYEQHTKFINCTFADNLNTSTVYENETTLSYKAYKLIAASGSSDTVSIPANSGIRIEYDVPGIKESDIITYNELSNVNINTNFRVVPRADKLVLIIQNITSSAITLTYASYNVLIFREYGKAKSITTVNKPS